MATVLETYYARKNYLDQQAQAAPLDMDGVWEYQELGYRLGVVESCRVFTQTAPESQDGALLLDHYHLLDAYIQNLTQERRLGPVPSENIQKQRETALYNLNQVIGSYRQYFTRFTPATVGQYKKEVGKVVNTVLPAWLQYRSTYVEIKSQKEGN